MRVYFLFLKLIWQVHSLRNQLLIEKQKKLLSFLFFSKIAIAIDKHLNQVK